MSIYVCLLDELLLGFLLKQSDIEDWWIWSHLDYHPCITSEPNNQIITPKKLKSETILNTENVFRGKISNINKYDI